MWFKNGGLVSAIFAVASAGAAVVVTWYSIARSAELSARMGQLEDIGEGLLTVFIMLAVGGLIAFAFDKAEDAIECARGSKAGGRMSEHD